MTEKEREEGGLTLVSEDRVGSGTYFGQRSEDGHDDLMVHLEQIGIHKHLKLLVDPHQNLQGGKERRE